MPTGPVGVHPGLLGQLPAEPTPPFQILIVLCQCSNATRTFCVLFYGLSTTLHPFVPPPHKKQPLTTDTPPMNCPRNLFMCHLAVNMRTIRMLGLLSSREHFPNTPCTALSHWQRERSPNLVTTILQIQRALQIFSVRNSGKTLVKNHYPKVDNAIRNAIGAKRQTKLSTMYVKVKSI